MFQVRKRCRDSLRYWSEKSIMEERRKLFKPNLSDQWKYQPSYYKNPYHYFVIGAQIIHWEIKPSISAPRKSLPLYDQWKYQPSYYKNNSPYITKIPTLISQKKTILLFPKFLTLYCYQGANNMQRNAKLSNRISGLPESPYPYIQTVWEVSGKCWTGKEVLKLILPL